MSDEEAVRKMEQVEAQEKVDSRIRDVVEKRLREIPVEGSSYLTALGALGAGLEKVVKAATTPLRQAMVEGNWPLQTGVIDTVIGRTMVDLDLGWIMGTADGAYFKPYRAPRD